MRTARVQLLSLLTLLCGVIALPARASPEAILLEMQPAAGELLEVWAGEGALPRSISKDLELGDETGGSVLRLLLAEADESRYRVSVQFETSMGIGDDGPHIDLLDWKHCRSDWRPAEPLADHGFRVPAPNEGDDSCFPDSTRGELREAVKRVMAQPGWDDRQRHRWIDIAKQVKVVGEMPSYVASSTVRVRIARLDGRSWIPLTTIDFRLPLGC